MNNRNGVVFMAIHIVRRGDSIYRIAKQYGVSIQQIIMDNGLAELPFLVIGQALLVLIPETVYVVRRGDTLRKIADLYGMTVNELLQKNPRLIGNRWLQVGDSVVIRFENESNRNLYINGYAYPNINRTVLQQTLPYLSSLTLFGYGFTEAGELIPIADSELIGAVYRYQAVPILLFSSITEDGNFSGERASALFRDLRLQNSVIEKLLSVMRQKGYLGIDIDFEYVNPEDGGAFLDFLANVTSQMHENGFFVNVDLAPKTSSEQQGLLYEAHDYAAIGAIADTVLLMTYEWGYTYGPPMAVAPLREVRQVVDYAVTQIPPEKIMLGIPNYGYDWKLPYERGISRATGIGNEYAVRLAAESGAEIQFDETVQAPFFEYTAQDGSKHIVWFEDVRSVQGKLDIIDTFGLRGAGYWTVMRPFAQNWALVSQRYAIQKLTEE